MSNVVHPPRFWSDAELVAALRERLPTAVDILFDRYGKDVRQLLGRLLGPYEDRADLLHDVFVEVLSSLSNLRDPNRLRPWILSIAANVARHAIRKKRRGRKWFGPPSDTEDLESARSENAAEQMQLTMVTYQILDAIPEDERFALLLRHFYEHELLEVAEILGVSESTARRRIDSAKERFLKLAKRHPEVSELMGQGPKEVSP